MNAKVKIGSKLVQANKPIGEGGEAVIYDISNVVPSTALKIWKPPSHPDYRGEIERAKRNREGARKRLLEYQTKLPAFPKNLPSRIIVPKKLAWDLKEEKIVGYGMDLLPLTQANVLRKYSKRNFREKVGYGAIIRIFADLHNTIVKTHKAGVVIADFNHLNVYVVGDKAYILDADAMQFGPYLSKVFTERFVDPLISNPKASSLIQVKAHSEETDWYAYNIMLFESLLSIHPYGGVYEPKDRSRNVVQSARALHRLSVFHPEVRYPSANVAVPLDHLDPDLLHYFSQVYQEDKRGEFPLDLLEGLNWRTCSSCNIVHSAAICPVCAHAAPPIMVREEIRGTARSKRVFQTSGIIVAASAENGSLKWIYNEGSSFKRENRVSYFGGEAKPGMRFRISGKRTVVANGPRMAILQPDHEPDHEPEQYPVDMYQGKLPAIASNDTNIFWIDGGYLKRDAKYSPEVIAKVLEGQTLFWVGPKFGFGFYRAGQITVNFVFSAKGKSLNDSVAIPWIGGHIIDATTYFSKSRAWFFLASKEGSKIFHRVAVLNSAGELLAEAEAEENDGSWLGTSIRGKSAARLRGKNGEVVHSLFSVSNDGIVRIDQEGQHIFEAAEYPDTATFVHPENHIFFTKEGIHVVKRNEVRLLTLKGK